MREQTSYKAHPPTETQTSSQKLFKKKKKSDTRQKLLNRSTNVFVLRALYYFFHL